VGPIEERPKKRGSEGEEEKTEDPHIVIRGITAAVPGGHNLVIQMKDMLADPGHKVVPE
jgi:hypothetical protein